MEKSYVMPYTITIQGNMLIKATSKKQAKEKSNDLFVWLCEEIYDSFFPLSIWHSIDELTVWKIHRDYSEYAKNIHLMLPKSI